MPRSYGNRQIPEGEQVMQLTPGKLWGMRRMASTNGIFKMTAVDQRPPIKGPIAQYHGVDAAPWEEVAKFKTLLIETLQSQSSAMLLDPHYAIPHGIDVFSPTRGLIVTLEDSLFQESNGGRYHQISTTGLLQRSNAWGVMRSRFWHGTGRTLVKRYVVLSRIL